MDYHPNVLKGEVVPHLSRITPGIVHSCVLEMRNAGLIQIYKVGTRDYIQVTNWKEHQKINKPQISRIPPPPGNIKSNSGNATGIPGTLPECSGNIQGTERGKRKEEIGTKRLSLYETLSGKPDDASVENPFLELVKSVIDALNAATGSSFKASSAKTRSLINARRCEGFELADFEAVIRHKAAEWRDDPKMRGFLRPETLFGTKFEGYLNAARASTPKPESASIGRFKHDLGEVAL